MIILILLLLKIIHTSHAHDGFDSYCRQNLDRTGNSLRQIFDSVGFQKVKNMSLPNTISDFEYSFPTNTTNTNQMRSFGVISTPLERLNGGHEGVDISGKLGSDVFAIRGGEVVYILKSCKNFKDKWCGNGWGNHIVIKHDNNFYSRYAHLDKVNVEKGDYVHSGTRIASLGSSGLSNGPHLHFEIGIKKDEFKDCLTPQNFDFVLDPKKLFR
jgi:murein DD-endopeptidase MepM/ murein hydrolase activator NlpD